MKIDGSHFLDRTKLFLGSFMRLLFEVCFPEVAYHQWFVLFGFGLSAKRRRFFGDYELFVFRTVAYIGEEVRS